MVEEDFSDFEEFEEKRTPNSIQEGGLFDANSSFSEDQNDEESSFNDNFEDGFDDPDMDGIAPIEKHQDLLKELTSFDDYIREKINGWLGLVWSETESKWVRNPHVEPIMNERCAAWCVDYLKTYARKNNIITNISQEEYKFIVTDMIDVLWLNIGPRADIDFGITNNGDILRVCTEMQHAAELVLMGAGGGKYNEFLGGIGTANLNGMPQMPQQIHNYGVQNRKAGVFGTAKKWLFGNQQ